jgi:hypothetical protein
MVEIVAGNGVRLANGSLALFGGKAREQIFRVRHFKESSSMPESVLAAQIHWVFH